MAGSKCKAEIGAPPLGEWFWQHVHLDMSGCWMWTGHESNTGYGYPHVPGTSKHEYAHRLTYTAFVAPIPDGLVIDHLCRNRKCCNPEHLEPVTQHENVMRSPIAVAANNARKTHCKRGHEFTAANTYCPPAGGRSCRACRAIHLAKLLTDPEKAERRRATTRSSMRRIRARGKAVES